MNRRDAFLQLVLARVREFYREPEALFWVYGFPLILAVLLGLAFSGTRPEPPVVDVQGAAEEQHAAAVLKALTDQGVKAEVHDEDSAKKRLVQGKTSLVVVPDGENLKYQFDPARSESVLAQKWIDSILMRARLGTSAPKADNIVLHEPGTRYIDFLLPGLIGMNIMGGGLFGIGFILVDMRVRKLFKRLMATPVRRGDFLLSLFVSRLLFLIPEMTSLLVFARWIFGVPMRGSFVLVAAIVLLGAFAFSGLGLLLGSRTDKTETMSGLINLTMLPMYLLSGIFFSPKRFPDAVQPLIQALPLTQLNESLREAMLEGLGFGDVAWRLGILAAWGVVTFGLALRWFKWN